jgi:hypothetical protein
MLLPKPRPPLKVDKKALEPAKIFTAYIDVAKLEHACMMSAAPIRLFGR